MIGKEVVRVFVLAGGLGTRLRSVVNDRPKPMALVNGKPFLEILVRWLYKKGFDEIVLLTGYRSEWIENHFRSFCSPSVLFSREDVPLGTGGAVKHAEALATDPTLLVNGDTFFDADIHRLLLEHAKEDPKVTLSLTEVPEASRYGSVVLDNSGRVVRFEEKAQCSKGPGLINAGMTALSRDAIKSLPTGRFFSMEKELFPAWASRGQMRGIVLEGAFFDIGTPNSYEEFQKFAKENEL